MKALSQPARRGNLVRYILYFITVTLIVAGLLGILLYSGTLRVLDTQAEKSSAAKLQLLMRSVDALLEQVDVYVTQLGLDRSVLKFMEYYRQRDLDPVLTANDQICGMMIANTYIHSIYLYYINEKSVYVPGRSVEPLRYFGDQGFLAAVLSEYAGRKWYTRTVADAVKGDVVPVISLVKFVSYDIVERPVLAVVNVSSNFVRSMMRAILADETVDFMVKNGQGQVICGSFRDPLSEPSRQTEALIRRFRDSTDRGEVLFQRTGGSVICTAEDPVLGWSFALSVPLFQVLGSIGLFRTYSILVFLLAIASGIAISLFFSNRISRPIRSLTERFPKLHTAPRSDVLFAIREQVDVILKENGDLERYVENQRPILKNSLLVHLLQGISPDDPDFRPRASLLGIHLFQYPHYVVLAVSSDPETGPSRISRSGNAGMMLLWLLKGLSAVSEGQSSWEVVEMGLSELAVIVNFDGGMGGGSDRYEKCRRLAECVHHVLSDASGGRGSIGVGNPCGRLHEIDRSYTEACSALRYQSCLRGAGTTLFSEIDARGGGGSRYSFKKERELFDGIRRGDPGLVKRAVGAVLESETALQSEDGRIRYLPAIQLLCSTIAFLDEMSCADAFCQTGRSLYTELLGLTELSSIRDWFIVLFGDVIRVIHKAKGSQNREKVAYMKGYIEAHYPDPLSLTLLADKVYMSPQYLCRIFKEVTGKSVKSHIDDVRIEHAKKLLQSTTDSVQRISAGVGYPEVHGFIKFFRRYAGMTPSEYRTTSLFVDGALDERRDAHDSPARGA